VRKLRQYVLQHVPRALKEKFVELGLRIIRVQGKITNRRFHQVLKEVSTEGKVWQVIPFLPGDFNQHRCVVDVRVRDGNAKPDIPTTSPPARADQNELPLRQ